MLELNAHYGFFKMWFGDGSPEDDEHTLKRVGTTSLAM